METPISESAFMGRRWARPRRHAPDRRVDVRRLLRQCCMDQIYTNWKSIYMSGGAVRLPLRDMTGDRRGYNDAAQHSQCLYGLFAHVPA